MPRSLALLLALATLSATGSAQTAAVPGNSDYLQTHPAPIQRATPYRYRNDRAVPVSRTTVSRPAPGVLLRVDQNSTVTTSSNAERTVLRVTRGLVNVSVHDPAENMLVLVDLPGGQTQLMENGLYTFNAETNTVRVFKGEADAFPGQATHPIKVKEDHQVAFAGTDIRSVDFDPDQARADLLPGDFPHRSERRYSEYPSYGAGFYGYDYPYYGYPYGFYGYPYGYPYGYGFGLGFGYFGGFRGGFGGFRHGWR